MTIDAQHWVWNHSSSKGNVRLVLLAVADKVTDAACVTRMGTTEFLARLNTSRSVVQNAVDKALLSGELKEIEPARGTIAAKYWMPFAANYKRPMLNARGLDSGPVEVQQGPGIEAPTDSQGPGIEAGSNDARGPESGPGGPGIEAPRGPESGPLNQQTTLTKSVSKLESQPEPVIELTIPSFARPLVDAISLAGYDTLGWNIKHTDWLIIHALINKHGTDRLARYAIEQCRRRDIAYGKYFLAGWRSLPAAPEPTTDGTPQLSVVRTPPPKNEDLFDRAMARAQARMRQENQ